MLIVGALALQVAVAVPQAGGDPAADPGLLYGKVTTKSGQVVEGFIRWDKTRATTLDIWPASKAVPDRNHLEAMELGGQHYVDCERGLHVRWGKVRWSDGCKDANTAQALIRLGHLQRLEIVDSRNAIAVLKTGDELELRGRFSSRSRGPAVAATDSLHEISWREVQSIEFLDAPATGLPGFGARIHGTLVTKDGEEFTGYVTWDADETFVTDTLDGDVRGEGRQRIRFSDIQMIERNDSRSALVTLTTGETLTLRGTNDVNNGIRGIFVNDLGLGRVRVEWHDFYQLRIHPPSMAVAAIPSPQTIRGTVTTSAGESYTGAIRWDNDEEFTWEMLDGDRGDMDFDVEFAMIQSIAKVSNKRAAVTLRDGRHFELSRSNDVNEENKGIVVTLGEGRMALVDWKDFARADFQH